MITIGYTIYNKAHLMPQIVKGIRKSFFPEDELIMVFDNCTDGSLEEFKKLEHTISCSKKIIVPKKELFEIKANNLILKEARSDMIVLFQDDIICLDPQIKQKIFRVFSYYGKRLGLLGGRTGFELDGKPDFPFKTHNVVSNWEHKQKQYGVRLKNGEWQERTILNRGPLVFTKELIEEIGYLDEVYFPLWCDCTDYSCKAQFETKRINVVFQCDVVSDLKWGSLREKNKVFPTNDGGKIKYGSLIKRNWREFIKRWGNPLTKHYENLVKRI